MVDCDKCVQEKFCKKLLKADWYMKKLVELEGDENKKR